MEPDPLQQVDRTYVRCGGGKFSYFAGCDYFRLASHPAVLRAAHQGIEKFGLNVAASRLTTGNHALYRKLEEELFAFFGSEDALVTGSGYLGNLVAAQGVAGDFSRALIDAKAHPGLQDAVRALACPVEVFKHRDFEGLARLVSQSDDVPLVLTDGLFSQNGEIAPLREYLKVLPKRGMILVDDAHGAGVLGKTGKGTPEYLGLGTERIIQTVTLSKAFGAYGGAILCSRALREKIVSRSPSFAGSTPMPLPLANAALQSVKILKTHPAMRRRLSKNVEVRQRHFAGEKVSRSGHARTDHFRRAGDAGSSRGTKNAVDFATGFPLLYSLSRGAVQRLFSIRPFQRAHPGAARRPASRAYFLNKSWAALAALEPALVISPMAFWAFSAILFFTCVPRSSRAAFCSGVNLAVAKDCCRVRRAPE